MCAEPSTAFALRRVTALVGPYGSGKTELAIGLSLLGRAAGGPARVAASGARCSATSTSSSPTSARARSATRIRRRRRRSARARGRAGQQRPAHHHPGAARLGARGRTPRSSSTSAATRSGARALGLHLRRHAAGDYDLLLVLNRYRPFMDTRRAGRRARPANRRRRAPRAHRGHLQHPPARRDHRAGRASGAWSWPAPVARAAGGRGCACSAPAGAPRRDLRPRSAGLPPIVGIRRRMMPHFLGGVVLAPSVRHDQPPRSDAMNRLEIDKDRCKACRLCIPTCNFHLLDLAEELNAKGYHPIAIHDSEQVHRLRACARSSAPRAASRSTRKSRPRRPASAAPSRPAHSHSFDLETTMASRTDAHEGQRGDRRGGDPRRLPTTSSATRSRRRTRSPSTCPAAARRSAAPSCRPRARSRPRTCSTAPAAPACACMTSSSSPGVAPDAGGLLATWPAPSCPAVVVNIMRGGPGLGGILPSQGDYFQATKGGGHGDYHASCSPRRTVQEAVDLMSLAFDLADQYRNPVLVIGDGLIGQMMEPVISPRATPKPSRQGLGHDRQAGDRKPNIINSLYLDPEVLEQHVDHALREVRADAARRSSARGLQARRPARRSSCCRLRHDRAHLQDRHRRAAQAGHQGRPVPADHRLPVPRRRSCGSCVGAGRAVLCRRDEHGPDGRGRPPASSAGQAAGPASSAAPAASCRPSKRSSPRSRSAHAAPCD